MTYDAEVVVHFFFDAGGEGGGGDAAGLGYDHVAFGKGAVQILGDLSGFTAAG